MHGVFGDVRAIPYPALHYLNPTLPYPILPYNTLPYPTLPYSTLPYPTLPCPALPYRTLPYPTLPYPTLPYCTLLYPTVPYPPLLYPPLPYPTLPYPTAVAAGTIPPIAPERCGVSPASAWTGSARARPPGAAGRRGPALARFVGSRAPEAGPGAVR